jgi:hypothetical protein
VSEAQALGLNGQQRTTPGAIAPAADAEDFSSIPEADWGYSITTFKATS